MVGHKRLSSQANSRFFQQVVGIDKKFHTPKVPLNPVFLVSQTLYNDRRLGTAYQKSQNGTIKIDMGEYTLREHFLFDWEFDGVFFHC